MRAPSLCQKSAERVVHRLIKGRQQVGKASRLTLLISGPLEQAGTACLPNIQSGTAIVFASPVQNVILCAMAEETKQPSDSDRIQGAQPAEPGEYGEKLRQLEADVKDLTSLFKHLLNSSPHGEQLIFMTMARIEEQDDAVLKFNETFRDLVKRKGLE
jgi:hypothetical protein